MRSTHAVLLALATHLVFGQVFEHKKFKVNPYLSNDRVKPLEYILRFDDTPRSTKQCISELQRCGHKSGITFQVDDEYEVTMKGVNLVTKSVRDMQTLADCPIVNTLWAVVS
jgi:hypothetical protein